MKKLIILATLIFLGTIAGYSQDCPPDKVCISREAAVKALTDADTVEAQKTELAADKQAIEDLKKIITDLKVELAKTTGELTGQQQMVVRLSAILDVMIKNTRKKSIGLIAF